MTLNDLREVTKEKCINKLDTAIDKLRINLNNDHKFAVSDTIADAMNTYHAETDCLEFLFDSERNNTIPKDYKEYDPLLFTVFVNQYIWYREGGYEYAESAFMAMEDSNLIPSSINIKET